MSTLTLQRRGSEAARRRLEKEILADSPIGFWKLSETSGTTAVDLSVSARNGTYTNGPTLGGTGPVAGDPAAAFASASSQRVVIPHNAALNYGDVFTLEAWIKVVAVSSGSTRAVIGKGPNTGYMRLSGSGNLMLLRSNVADMMTSTVALPDTTDFHHVVATKNGSTIKLYIDAVDRSGSPNNSTCTNSTSDLGLGADGGTADPFNGAIGYAAIYASELSAARVLAHYQSRT